jgi:hypothetical protein
MSSTKVKTAGTTFHIGTTASNAAADTYTQIKGAKAIGGDLGATFQVVDTTDIDDTVKQETKTLMDAGTVDLEMHEVTGDGGQGALYAAFLDVGDVPYNFRVSYPAPTSDKRYIKAKVLSWQPMVGGANAVRMIRVRLSMTSVSTYAS